ncbi:MAG: cation:proton antiporter [Caldilineaceae bacterium]|nr:cation:proton antiporter [Caldilineaceae bacterium]
MPELAYIKDLVIVLGAAVVVVTLLQRVGLPSIAGFILTGALVGPTALGLVDDTHQVEVLAEIGVALLLFSIGLELSLDRLRYLWKAVLLGGGLQVTLTIACTAALSLGFGLAPGPAVFLGCVVAVSSTAIVLRGLSNSGELEAPHGRLAVGILVFQDLCVIPMMLAVPYLAGEGGNFRDILTTVGIVAVVIPGVLVAAGRVVPRLLEFVSQTRERELFILSVFLLCFGIAWLLSLVGIKLALGAFLAGLIVSGYQYRHQVMADLIPAREVLASLFFVSVGMLLDVSDVLEHLGPTVGLLGMILAGKFVIILGTALILRLPLRVAILSAATLCQIGEFSFVLMTAGGMELLGTELAHSLLVAIILSMLLTPLVIAFEPHLAGSAARVPWLNRLLDAEPPGIDVDEPHRDHVIVAGCDQAGRHLCQAIGAAGHPYVAVDWNPDHVHEAHDAGVRAVLGDMTQSQVLEELDCSQARLVILNFHEPNMAEAALHAIREAAPDVAVIALVQYELDRELLLSAGASTVVTAEVQVMDGFTDSCLAALEPNTGRPT